MLKNIKNYIPKEAELKVLDFWRKEKIFEKSLKRGIMRNKLGRTRNSKTKFDAGRVQKIKDYVFYDGPPFATGTPHYGHIVASTIKDVVPRFWTMKGYRVGRKWGWDCHGLPIENIAEKELGIKRKKEIEKFGIEKFNEFCRSKVLDYADDWKEVIGRLGRWVDMENPYKTMDPSYMESVWWVFKELWDQGLIYEGYRSMHICTRCETTLSQQEVSEGYNDVRDISATVKFELLTRNSAERTRTDAEEKTYILAWTTTPWTLIGNVALAINSKITYSKVKIQKSKAKVENQNAKVDETYIIAKSRIDQAFKDFEYKIITEFEGSELVGKEYKPLFDYYVGKGIQNEENGWKIYPADFVTTEEGTGIVHIAPAFGEDDLKLGQKYKLPFIQHVGMDGLIKPEAADFAGLSVKPQDDHQKTDIEIIKFLAKTSLLFSKESYLHSYPHCWRCDTPLINYATSSWFVDIPKIKSRALKLAKRINWVPGHVKEGRFGNWLKGAREWSISRQRFWASAIPIWKCQGAEIRGADAEQRRRADGCKEVKVVGSVAEIKELVPKSGNKYFAMRHGEAEENVDNITNSDIKKNHFRLTEKGRKQVLNSAKKLKKEKIDLIFSSDFLRTKETAEIVAKTIGFDVSKIIFDRRLREINEGEFDGQDGKKYHEYFSSIQEKFFKAPPKGETLNDLKRRMTEFLYDIGKKYSNKNILIVSHEYPIWNLVAGANGLNVDETIKLRGKRNDFVKFAEVKKIRFVPVPHNKNYELDLHRPYIDEIKFKCKKCGGEMKRIPDVLDTWFDSGSMPYAQMHYPFDNKKNFEDNFPAEFIGEGIDQTRAWFYYLHSIAAAIMKSNAYKNVVVNGIVLAEDGKKMSKRLQNYPDPMDLINKYGADALRLYLISSPVVEAENLNFSEKGVDEVYKKVILRLWNVYGFYDTYTENLKTKKPKNLKPKSTNVLDKWILARLEQVKLKITKALDSYELDKASRSLGIFVDDLSTWYLRRSRERFKETSDKRQARDRENAIATTRFALLEFSKIAAPFIPFISEVIYKELNGSLESVHLEDWPQKATGDKRQETKLIEEMEEVRRVVSFALEERAKAGIKVRQPLSELRIKNYELRLKQELLDLIKEEVNVKKIVVDKKMKNKVELDMKITPELKAEGNMRDLIRIIQDLRKQAGYIPQDRIEAFAYAEDSVLKQSILDNADELKRIVGARNFEFRKTDKIDSEIETKIDGINIWAGIKRMR